MQSTLAQRSPFVQLATARRLARATLVIAMIGVAYHYSLATLLRGLTLQTPLAYLALVPMIAVALAWYRVTAEPDHGEDGLPLDFVLGRVAGVGMLLAAVVLALLVPVSVRLWLARVDLLSLPLFAAGTITFFYGVRRAWILRFPIAFLLLAWPAAYSPIVTDLTDALTSLTITFVRAVSTVLPLATASGSGDLFMVQHAGGSFPIVIASACAGVNSVVGHLLVGTALAYVVKGTIVRRVAWVIAGLVIIWLLNLVRIEAIFVIGAAFGREAALDVLHPIAGLFVFNVGVLLMLALTPRFGLYFAMPAASGPAREPFVRHPRLHNAFLGLTVALALSLAAVNAGYARYEPLANGLGTARLMPLSSSSAADIGWESGFVATFDGGKQFFGETSTWVRHQYLSTAAADLRTTAPLYLDTISVDDPNVLTAYGLDACYRFHGYIVERQEPVELAPGVAGEVITYHNPKLGADWSALWWEWPFQDDERVRYQRVVLFVFDGSRAEFEGVDPSAAGTDSYATAHAFLEALASELVRTHVASEVGDA